MKIYKNEELRKQIVDEGSKWIAQQEFWLFGTATYCNGNLIKREKAERDAKYYFNRLDRKALKRIDYEEGRKIDRLVFIETGRTRTNPHIHFFIKGNDYVDYRQIEELCVQLWDEKIEDRLNLKMLDNMYAGNRRNGYCWKEMNDLNADVFHAESSHINLHS